MHFTCVNDRVEKIKLDEEQINKFVQEYKPFIASCTEKMTGRYMRYGEDDELSIALMAFVEAIHAYSCERGNFLPFARNVIKRRLIDYYRKEKKHNNVISLNEHSLVEDEEKDRSIYESIDRYILDEAMENRRLEIKEFRDELAKWEISFDDLVSASPKHSKTRKLCNEISQYILSQPELVETMKTKKYLPVAEIEKSLDISRKKIERARRYIIAVILVKTGDYRYLQEYMG